MRRNPRRGNGGGMTASERYAQQYQGGASPLNRQPGSPVAPAAASTPAAAGGPPATPFDQGAYDVMLGTLKEYGLESLAPDLWGLIQGGVTDAASIQMHLQETPAWKQRFAGNERLRAAGIPVLSPAEYIATERSYAQIMRNYGLPSGFYDDPSDFANWIGNNVSANELQQRVSAYSDLAAREDSAIVSQLASMGMTKGDLLAFMIDPSRATPIIQQQYQTALLGASARRSGVTADNQYLSQLAARGVSEDQASQGYGLIGQNLAAGQRLGLSQQELESEVFDNNAGATKKRKRLASQERAQFSGSSGIVAGSLGQSASGSY